MLQYKSMVHPHLQHCLWFWSLCLKKNVSELGKHQKKSAGLSWTYGPLLETGAWIWWTLVTIAILTCKNSYKLKICSVWQKWSLEKEVSLTGKKKIKKVIVQCEIWDSSRSPLLEKYTSKEKACLKKVWLTEGGCLLKNQTCKTKKCCLLR